MTEEESSRHLFLFTRSLAKLPLLAKVNIGRRRKREEEKWDEGIGVNEPVVTKIACNVFF